MVDAIAEALGLAAALLAARGPRPADEVRRVAHHVLTTAGHPIPSGEWPAWGIAVRKMRARGMLIEDLRANTWQAGRDLHEPDPAWLLVAQRTWTDGVEVKP